MSNAKSNCSAVVRKIANAKSQAQPSACFPKEWSSRIRSIYILLISCAKRYGPMKFVMRVPEASSTQYYVDEVFLSSVPAWSTVGRQRTKWNLVCRIDDQRGARFPTNQICVWSHMTGSISRNRKCCVPQTMVLTLTTASSCRWASKCLPRRIVQTQTSVTSDMRFGNLLRGMSHKINPCQPSVFHPHLVFYLTIR